MNQFSNNKRIAINSLFLYLRMLFVMGVSIYTSRVVLNTLGVMDYGIYSVVSGVVAALGFINTSISGATSRFITYAIGLERREYLYQIFSTIKFIHYVLAAFLFLLCETILLWFLYYKIVIPVERMDAAFWAFQCSVLSSVITVTNIPYTAQVLAHEKMGVFAYISIFEVLSKLGIVYLLAIGRLDRLVLYSVLLLFVQLLVRLLYTIYCTKTFEETRVKIRYESAIGKEMLTYSFWTVGGNLAVVGYTQGISILLNIFFGPVVNAARSLAVQVQASVVTVLQSFQMAVRPQIVKSYANENWNDMHRLVVYSSKFGFYISVLFIFPLLICIQPILHIWLIEIPPYTAELIAVMLFAELLTPIKGGMLAAIHATGDIKRFQLYESSILLLVVPLSYISLRWFHSTPQVTILIYAFVELICLFVRAWIVLPKIRMSWRYYLSEVMKPIIFISMAMGPLYYFFPMLPNDVSLLEVFVSSFSLDLFLLIILYIIGLNRYERSYASDFVLSFLRKLWVKSV